MRLDPGYDNAPLKWTSTLERAPSLARSTKAATPYEVVMVDGAGHRLASIVAAIAMIAFLLVVSLAAGAVAAERQHHIVLETGSHIERSRFVEATPPATVVASRPNVHAVTVAVVDSEAQAATVQQWLDEAAAVVAFGGATSQNVLIVVLPASVPAPVVSDARNADTRVVDLRETTSIDGVR